MKLTGNDELLHNPFMRQCVKNKHPSFIPTMLYMPHLTTTHIPYSGKIWCALNLAILVKTAYFFNLANLKFADLVSWPKWHHWYVCMCQHRLAQAGLGQCAKVQELWVRPATSQPWRPSKWRVASEAITSSVQFGAPPLESDWTALRRPAILKTHMLWQWWAEVQSLATSLEKYMLPVLFSWEKNYLLHRIWSWRFTTNLPQGDLKVPCMLTFRGKSKDVARMKKLVVPITCSNPGETQQPRKKVEDRL